MAHRMVRIKKRIKKLKPRLHRVNLGRLIAIGAFAVVGLVGLLLVRADTNKITFEPEAGTITGNATLCDDTTASGNKSVQFGGSDAAPCMPFGYTLVWHDEFDGTAIDQTKWNIRTGGAAPSTIRFVDDTVGVADGIMTLSAYTENGLHYSGEINSKNKYQPKFGYIEARVKFETLEHFNQAFWLFHSTVNSYGDPWNHGVEFDIFEHSAKDWQGKDTLDKLASNVNWGQYGNDWPNHPNLGSGQRGTGLSKGYHTVAMEWTPDGQKYYIDGQYLWSLPNSNVSPVSRRDQYIILSQGIEGGADKNYGSKASRPGKMQVDYVRVYQKNPATPPAPTSVTKAGSSGTFRLNWQLTANAERYTVKRATTSSGPYATIATTTNLTYTDTTGNPGSAYYYVVTASNSTGESRNSAEVRSLPNLARGKTGRASSGNATSALDGNPATRWGSASTDPQWLYVDLGAPMAVNGVMIQWEAAYGQAYTIDVSNDAANWTTVYRTTTGNGDTDDIGFPTTTARYVRVNGSVRHHKWTNPVPYPYGYSIWEFEVYGAKEAPTPQNLVGYTNNQSVRLNWEASPGASSYTVKRATTPGGPYTTVASGLTATNFKDTGLTNGTTYYHVVTATNAQGESAYSNEVVTMPRANIAFWQQTYTSSLENTDRKGYKAVDGTTDPIRGISTLWHSAYADPQWITVDLQTTYPINRVVLNWDFAWASAYKVQVSNDNANWTDVCSTTTGNGGIDDLAITPVNARYVRMYGTQRGTRWGYSLKEFEVYAVP